MNVAYYDTSYLVKLYCSENGSEEVLNQAAKFTTIVCSLHGRTEFVAAGHRKLREGSATSAEFGALVTQMGVDTSCGALQWTSLTEVHYALAESVFRNAPSDVYLRAADALHLACAAECGFTEIYSNDRHLLAAAPLFGLVGVNVIR